MIIRPETPADYQAINDLVKRAFATTSFSDGTEADYLMNLRQRDEFIPDLALVAVKDGQIVGQVVLYQMSFFDQPALDPQLVLSPLSVAPEQFGQGIGMALIEAGLSTAKQLGYQAVFLCGDPAFYTKHGFKPSYQHGICHVNDPHHQADWCLVRELIPGFLETITGRIDIV